MAVKTIAELKALWVDGYVPSGSDYTDLFDTLESVSPDDNVFTKEFIYDSVNNPMPDSTEITLLYAPGANQYISVKKIKVIMDNDNGGLEMANAYFYYDGTGTFSGSDVDSSIGGGGGLEVFISNASDLESAANSVKQAKALKAYYASGLSAEAYNIKVSIEFSIETI